MICTSIEQSRRLLELGLDPKTADMFWMDTNSVSPCLKLIDDGIFNHRNYLVRFPNTSSLAWSLSALLEVMPTAIEIDGLGYDLELFKAIDDDTDLPYYGVRYVYNDDYHLDYYESGSNIIEQAFAMVCILIEQGLIKKGGEE